MDDDSGLIVVAVRELCNGVRRDVCSVRLSTLDNRVCVVKVRLRSGQATNLWMLMHRSCLECGGAVASLHKKSCSFYNYVVIGIRRIMMSRNSIVSERYTRAEGEMARAAPHIAVERCSRYACTVVASVVFHMRSHCQTSDIIRHVHHTT